MYIGTCKSTAGLPLGDSRPLLTYCRRWLYVYVPERWNSCWDDIRLPRAAYFVDVSPNVGLYAYSLPVQEPNSCIKLSSFGSYGHLGPPSAYAGHLYMHADKIHPYLRPTSKTFTRRATMAVAEYKYLTPDQREHFLQHGWIKVPKAVKEEYLRAFTDNVWVRLGYDPEDKATWTKEKVSLRVAIPALEGLKAGHCIDPHATAPRDPDGGVHAPGVGRDVCALLLICGRAGTTLTPRPSGR